MSSRPLEAEVGSSVSDEVEISGWAVGRKCEFELFGGEVMKLRTTSLSLWTTMKSKSVRHMASAKKREKDMYHFLFLGRGDGL